MTGTDTGVGKTLVSCALLYAFAARDKRVVGMKPVAAGCDDDKPNEDVQALRAASNVLATLGQINPYSFLQPVAPHIAASHAGVPINFERIVESYKELSTLADIVIVEGAGGLLVPLGENTDMADLAARLELPVILVVGMRLGCLNHALLTLSAIRSRGLHCAGWVANIMDPQQPFLQENIESLKLRLHSPLLGIVPHQDNPDAKLAAPHLDISLLR